MGERVVAVTDALMETYAELLRSFGAKVVAPMPRVRCYVVKMGRRTKPVSCNMRAK